MIFLFTLSIAKILWRLWQVKDVMEPWMNGIELEKQKPLE
jgi:hypothetical protein